MSTERPANTWSYESKTTPGKFYTVKLLPDGVFGCDCPSWRFVKGTTRTCTHVKTTMALGNVGREMTVTRSGMTRSRRESLKEGARERLEKYLKKPSFPRCQVCGKLLSLPNVFCTAEMCDTYDDAEPRRQKPRPSQVQSPPQPVSIPVASPVGIRRIKGFTD